MLKGQTNIFKLLILWTMCTDLKKRDALFSRVTTYVIANHRRWKVKNIGGGGARFRILGGGANSQ